jgi:FAD/FMN-containing dehydrogenase
MSLKETIQSLLKGEVYDDPKTLDSVSRDASLFEITPKLVVSPKDSADICRLVEYINSNPDQKLSLTARSAGTDMSGAPLTESIVVNMLPHFNKILEVGSNYAITELPCYTASRELNTVGGMVANNSGGEKTLSFGKTEEYIEELSIVLADGKEYVVKALNKQELEQKMSQPDFEGELYRNIFKLIDSNYDLIKNAKPKVSKNSAGYYLWNVWDRETGIFDLNKVIVGSQGTLGIVTKIKFRLITPKEHSRLLVIFLKNLNGLGDLVNKVLTFKPESFESYDDHTLKLAMRFAPEMAKVLKGSMISMALSFIPEAFTVLSMGSLPKLVIMAEFTGDSEEEVDKKVREAHAAIKPLKLHSLITKSEQEGKKYWTVRRESFSLLRKHVHEKHTAPFIDDTVVTPDQLPEFLPALDAIMAKYDLTYTIAGHIGDANFHIIPLMNLADPKTQDIIPKLSEEVYDLVYKFHGSITGEHNDGMIRTPYLEGMYGSEVYHLFEETKKFFDPHNVFNPGKKVHGDLAYAMKHFVNDSHVHADAGRWVAPKEKKA